MPPEKKVRTSPRLSLSKLAEFLTASPLRQRSILVEQKFPKSYVTARYTPAEGAIARFLQTGDAAVIDDATATLEAAGAGTEWEADQNRLCAEAISAFLDVADDVLGRGLVFERSENHVPSIAVAGVDVSVRPELLARDGDRRVRGAVKLYFSKSHPLGDDGGAYSPAPNPACARVCSSTSSPGASMRLRRRTSSD